MVQPTLCPSCTHLLPRPAVMLCEPWLSKVHISLLTSPLSRNKCASLKLTRCPLFDCDALEALLDANGPQSSHKGDRLGRREGKNRRPPALPFPPRKFTSLRISLRMIEKASLGRCIFSHPLPTTLPILDIHISRSSVPFLYSPSPAAPITSHQSKFTWHRIVSSSHVILVSSPASAAAPLPPTHAPPIPPSSPSPHPISSTHPLNSYLFSSPTHLLPLLAIHLPLTAQLLRFNQPTSLSPHSTRRWAGARC